MNEEELEEDNYGALWTVLGVLFVLGMLLIICAMVGVYLFTSFLVHTL